MHVATLSSVSLIALLGAAGVMAADVVVIAQGYALYATIVFALVVTFGLILMAHERHDREYAHQFDDEGELR